MMLPNIPSGSRPKACNPSLELTCTTPLTTVGEGLISLGVLKLHKPAPERASTV